MNRDQRTRMRHALAAVAGIAVFVAISVYTGEANLWLAVQFGIGTALIIYFWSHFNDHGAADEDT